MKAFIFAFLVATVAARSFDLDTLRHIKEKSLLNSRPVLDDELLKEKLISELPVEKTLVDKVYPVEDKTVLGAGLKGIYDFDYDNVNFDQVLTFDELYNTQLFRQYLSLPLFREYIQYPSFQRYVASVYFQKFWQIPTFRQYFLNPVLFYKYIYPQVQLFHSEYTLPMNYIYGQQDNVYSQDLDDVYYRNKNVFTPYVYNNRYGLPTSRFAGQYLPYGTETTNYKFLLDKVYKNLFPRHQVVGDLTQVKADIKTLTGEKTVVVEPITGERKVVVEPKIVETQVDKKILTVPVEKVDEVFEKKTVDDVLLLNVLLKKHLITPEIFESVVRGHIDFVTVLRQILGQYVDITDVTDKKVLFVKVLFHKNIITPEVYEAVLRGQIGLHSVLRHIFGEEFDFNTFNTVTERDVLLIKVLLKKHIITPEIYEAVIRGQVELFTVLRQIYGQYFDFTTVHNRDVLLVKILLKEHIITPEIYEAVIRGQVEFDYVLRQILGQYVDINDFVNRRDVVDYTIPTVNRFDRFVGNDRFNLDKLYKYNSLYNTELPTLRKNIFNRLPLQNLLGNIVA